MRVIAGSARRLPLKSLPGEATRPTTDRIKETLFNILSPRLAGARFLDLFAGCGGIGIEALSRGAQSAVFVDRAADCVEVIRENLQFTHLDAQAEVIRSDAASALRRMRMSAPFDLVFLDPPYDGGLEPEVLSALYDRRDALLAEDALIVIEAAKERDFSYVNRMGYQITREKIYKTNKHVFLEMNYEASNLSGEL